MDQSESVVDVAGKIGPQPYAGGLRHTKILSRARRDRNATFHWRLNVSFQNDWI